MNPALVLTAAPPLTLTTPFTVAPAQEIDFVSQHRPATLVASLVADTDLVQRAMCTSAALAPLGA